MSVRLQKFLADAGIASRRASETIITQGRVRVNGVVARELGTRVDPAVDQVWVDGHLVKERRKIYVALNKPPGYLASRKDPLKRKTVGDLLPKEWAHLYPVGRLDYNSEGLLLLTNDGEFALRLTHPRYGVRKIYHATVEGRINPAVLTRMTEGVYHEGERLVAERTRILKSSNSRTLVEIELREGKNREIRRLFQAQDIQVEQLQRIQIGPLRLGQLPLGKWRVLTPAEIRSLLAASGK